MWWMRHWLDNAHKFNLSCNLMNLMQQLMSHVIIGRISSAYKLWRVGYLHNANEV